MTPQGSSDAHAATAAAPSARHVQGQFDDAEQGGGSGDEYDPDAPLEAEAAGEAEREAERAEGGQQQQQQGKKKGKKRGKRANSGTRKEKKGRE